MIFDITACEEIIGYSFNDKSLLRQCFTHSSYANEHSCADNEVLEFYGDAIMDFIVTEYLFKNVAGNEGRLTEVRAKIVSKAPLLRVVRKLGLDKYILLGRGQKHASSAEDKMYSSLYEAVVAGMYIDGGIEPTRKFVHDTLICEYLLSKSKGEKKGNFDSKTQFQEYVQKYRLGSISYKVLHRTGPDHLPFFKVGAMLNEKCIAEGEGGSKKHAEAEAAERALKKLKEQGGNKQ